MKLFKSKQQIQSCISELAIKINSHQKTQPSFPLILVNMNGGMYFATDLTRRFDFRHKLNFISTSSYQDNVGGKVTVDKAKLVDSPDVIYVIEDIVDRGDSMLHLIAKLREKNPNTLIETITLLQRTTSSFECDFVGFRVAPEDGFFYGYGMDNGGLDRNLQSIYTI